MTCRRTAEQATAVVARLTGLRPAEICGRGQHADIVAARQVAMWVTRRLAPRASLPAIGRAFGGKHHTTVLHALRKVERATGELGELRDEALRLAEGAPREPERRAMLDVDRACSAVDSLISELCSIRDRLRALTAGGNAQDGQDACAEQAMRWLHVGNRLTPACLGFLQPDRSSATWLADDGRANVEQ